MRNRFFIAATMFFLVVSLVAVSSFEGTEAADQDGDIKEYYFYGDHPIFRYYSIIGDNITVSWDVTGIHGENIVPERHDEKYSYIQIDVSDQGEGPVVVRQTVSSASGGSQDSSTVLAYPLHVQGEYTVVFMDGSKVFDKQVINNTTVVEKGRNHVVMPSGPVKGGYTFDGWFTDQNYTTEFDPTKPIRGDTTVYAKWVGTGPGSGSGTTVINNTHVVTFDTVTGLEYDVVNVGTTRVSFTVGVVGGYQLKEGTLSVTSDHGYVTLNDGIYTLMNVNTNTTVFIDGDLELLPTEDTNGDGDCDFPWWIILLVILIAVIVIVMIWWRYRKNEPADEKKLVDGIKEDDSEVSQTDNIFQKKD